MCWLRGGRSARCRQRCFAHLPLGGGGLRTEAAVLNNPAALPNCRENSSLWRGRLRPGATRRPWRGSPLRRLPDGLPALLPPPLGPSDGTNLKSQHPKPNVYREGAVCTRCVGGYPRVIASRHPLPHPLLNKNLIKHDLGQTKPFPHKNVCASLETQKAQGACWR